MSNPQKRIRQPGGRKKYFDNSHFPCGVCKQCVPESLGITITGFDGYDPSYGSWYSGWCGSISATGVVPITDFTLPLDGELGSYCALSKANTGSDAYCSYTGSFNTGVKTFRVDVQISCVPGSPDQLSVSVILRGDNGDGTFTDVAHGQYLKDLPDGCGTADCSQGAGDLACSGDFTLYGGMSLPWCSKNANNPGTATFQIVGAGPCKSCDSLAAPCCCGGKQPKRCLYVCLNDPTCSSTAYDVRVCQGDSGGAIYTGTDALSGDTASMTYTAGDGYEVSYTCGDTTRTHTFAPGDDGWGKVGGKIALTYTDPDEGWILSAGIDPQCPESGAIGCTVCKDLQMAKEYQVEIGTGWTVGVDPDVACPVITHDSFACDPMDCIPEVEGEAHTHHAAGIPGTYFPIIPFGSCSLQGAGVPYRALGPDGQYYARWGCCFDWTGPAWSNTESDCFLTVGHDDNGYYIVFELRNTSFNPVTIWGRWKKYYEDPPDCLHLVGEELPMVAVDPSEQCGYCIPSGVTCTVTAL